MNALKRWLKDVFSGNTRRDVIFECRHCGTQVNRHTTNCRVCGTAEIATYRLSIPDYTTSE